MTRRVIQMLGAILLLAAAAYLPVLSNGFINLDDDRYIQNNPLVQGFPLREIFSSYVVGNYHPLTLLTYAVEHALFGPSPSGHHLVSLLLHLANVAMVFLLIRDLDGDEVVALVASLLFAVHPIHVESVAWASEQKDLLYAFFFLASARAYLAYLREERRDRYWQALALFVCSLLSKAMAASLPLVLLLIDHFRRRKLDMATLGEKVPFFALSLVFGMVAIHAQHSLNAIQTALDYGLLQRLVFACTALVMYVVQIVVPFRLSVFYGYPMKPGEAVPPQYYAFVVLVLVVLAVTLLAAKRSRTAVFAVGFFLATVGLVLQLLPVGDAMMADRYAYLPSIAVFYAVGVVAKEMGARHGKVVLGLVGVLAMIYGVQTHRRVPVWRDSMTLWNDVIAQGQDWALAYNNRGVVHSEQGRLTEAYADFSRAVEIQPMYADAYQNRATALRATTRYAEMRRDLDKALEIRPDFFEALVNRGNVSRVEHRNEDALRDFDRAIALRADLPHPFLGRGLVLVELGKEAEACAAFQTALQLGDRSAQAQLEQHCRDA